MKKLILIIVVLIWVISYFGDSFWNRRLVDKSVQIT